MNQPRHVPPQRLTVDFRLDNHGSICVLHALSREGRDWVSENLPDDRLRWGVTGTVIEPRYVEAIIDGITESGLRVS